MENADDEWEDYDIMAGTSEMPDSATEEERPRTTPRVDESNSHIVSEQMQEGVMRLSVSR